MRFLSKRVSGRACDRTSVLVGSSGRGPKKMEVCSILDGVRKEAHIYNWVKNSSLYSAKERGVQYFMGGTPTLFLSVLAQNEKVDLLCLILSRSEIKLA